MKARARVYSCVGTTRGSSWFPLHSKLRMVIRQNTRRRHVKLEGPQFWILFYFVDEFVSKSSRIRFAIHGNLPRRLVVRCNAHVGGGQAFEEVLQHFDRVIMPINRRRQRFPLCFCRAHKLSSGRVAPNTPVKPSYLKPHHAKIQQQEKEKRAINATRPKESFLPFCLPYQLQATASPAFRQKVELNRCWRKLDANYFGGAGKNPLYGVAQLVAGLIQQH